MIGKEIGLDFTGAYSRFDGKDSLFKSPTGNKLVVFVDSTSCTGCFLNKLPTYYEISDMLMEHGSSLIIVMHPRMENVEEMVDKLRHEKFPFWCILDKEGEFLKQNEGFTENPLLHTFLLGDDNRIKLVGSPIYNPQITNLILENIKSQ